MSFGPTKKSPSPGYTQEPGYGRIVDGKIYVGIVKNNIDLQKMGRLEVHIPDIGGDPDDSSKWFVVSYASPFAGATSIENNKKDSHEESGTQKSYGWWAVPPDLENLVLVLFINGEATRGIWFACLYQQNMNHMVPGIASNTSFQGGYQGILPPVAEYNKDDQSVNPVAPQRPRFEPLHQGLLAQGLYTDFERGPSDASARRLASDQGPAEVYGLSTPRSNTLYIDDDPTNEYIRIRTRGGTQVLVHETNGYVYINSGKGNSWIEVSDDGVDIYSKGNVSLRSEQDVNIHADKNINLNAGGNINAKAGAKAMIESGSDMHLKSGGKLNAQAANDMNFKGNSLKIESGGAMDLKAGGAMAQSGSKISQLAGTITRDGAISDNGGGSAAAGSADGASSPSTVNQVDGSRSITTTVTRMPTHEPWKGHPKAKNATPPRGDVPVTDVSGPGSSGKPYDSQTVDQSPTRKQRTGDGGDKLVVVDDYSNPKVNIGNKKVPGPIEAAISKASSITNVDYGFMMAMAEKESSFNPNAKAPTSSASGLYQFLDSTWNRMVDKYGAQHGITRGDKLEPLAAAIMAGYFTKENAAIISKRTGRPCTSTELYMGHFLSGAGAAKLLTANQSTPAVDVAGAAAAQANASIFYKNGTPRTCQEVTELFGRFIEPRAQAYAANRPSTKLA